LQRPLVLVLVLALVQLLRVLVLVLVPVPVPVPVPVLGQVLGQVPQQARWHHRSPQQPLRGSSWRHASIDRCCFSRHHRTRCASYELLVRQPLM
jgi:hypothetical protein